MAAPRMLKECVRSWLHAGVTGALVLRSRPYRFDRDSAALVIAPHPDDEAFGCAGIIRRKRQRGERVHVAYITDGSAGCPGHPLVAPEDLARRREAEAREAMSLLGVAAGELSFIGATDGTLSHLGPDDFARLAEEIGAVIDRVRPNELLLPGRWDGTDEHEATFALVTRAFEARPKDIRLLEYPVWARWDPRRLARPLMASRNVWRVSLGGDRALKREAVACYRSQVAPSPPWKEPMLSAKFVAFQCSGHEFFFET